MKLVVIFLILVLQIAEAAVCSSKPTLECEKCCLATNTHQFYNLSSAVCAAEESPNGKVAVDEAIATYQLADVGELKTENLDRDTLKLAALENCGKDVESSYADCVKACPKKKKSHGTKRK